MNIPKKMKAWLKAEGLSYEAAGRRLGCSGQSVRFWVTNGKEPKNDTMRAKVIRTLNTWERENDHATP